MFRTLIILPLTILISLMSLNTASAQEGFKINFSICAEYLIEVPVKVNNKSALYLLDTGANRTVVGENIPELQMVKSSEEVITLSGRAKVETGVLNKFVIGNQAILQKEVIRVDLSNIKKTCPEVEGVLGNDILANINYLINYERKEIQVSRSHIATVPINYLSFEELEGRIFIPIKYHNQAKRLILDTAASTTTFFEKEFKNHAKKNAGILSEGGQIDALFVKADIQIGAVKFDNCNLGIINMNSPERTENGLLATRIFRRLYVDNISQYIAFD